MYHRVGRVMQFGSFHATFCTHTFAHDLLKETLMNDVVVGAFAILIYVVASVAAYFPEFMKFIGGKLPKQ